jgi:phosphate starvation-inducible PhoH-like protein
VSQGGESGHRVLRDLDLLGTRSHTKFVPDDYLYNSAEVRLAVLQGLLDSDGGPVTQKDRTCRVQYSTTSILLRDDVIALVQSLGGVAYGSRRAAEGRKPGRANGRDVHHRRDAHVSTSASPKASSPSASPASATRTTRPEAADVRCASSTASSRRAGRRPSASRWRPRTRCTSPQDYLLTHNTLNDAFIILDEAQNTSPEQMKMFLTRLGFESKIVITGDVTQVDLPSGTKSGLRQVQDILEGLDDVHFSRLTSQDVVRHKLVGRIVDAYEKYDSENGTENGTHRGARNKRK